MEINFHAHHAAISPRLRRRAEVALERMAKRLSRAVDAIVRFEQDGPVKRVEIVLRAPRQRRIVALGEAKFYGSALTTAIDKLEAQVRKLRRPVKSTLRKGDPKRRLRATILKRGGAEGAEA